jgi:hypothetical protein
MNLSIKELNELIYSLGITASKGIMCDKELNVSLLNKLYDELNARIAEEAIDEEVESSTYYVSNEEADEDYRSTLLQDSQRYEDSKKFNGITQKLLDYVDRRGAVSYTELHTYYKIHSGSNSFSHILANLRIPYKNRKTQRYLAKEGKRYSDALYVIKVANPSNWVVKEYDEDDFRTFNEAPYGND